MGKCLLLNSAGRCRRGAMAVTGMMHMMQFFGWRRCALVLGVCACGVPVGSALGAVYRVQGSGGKTFDTTSGSELSDGFHVFGSAGTGKLTGFEAAASVTAGPGGIHARANSSFFQQGTAFGGDSVDPSVTGDVKFDDVVITGPTGPVTVSYRLHLSGSLEATAQVGISELSAAARIEVQMLGNGILVTDDGAVKYNDLPQRGSGNLANFTGDAILTSGTFTVQANQPFSVQFRIGADAQSILGTGEDGLASATSDFSNTLTFATGGPVFNLPAGYFANSPSAGIINNVFAVPEPASFGILLPAMLLLRRRKIRRAGQ